MNWLTCALVLLECTSITMAAPPADPKLGGIGMDKVQPAPSKAADRAFTAGTAHLRAGDAAGAKKDFDRALAATGEFLDARFARGLAEARLGELAAARKDLEAVAAVDLPQYAPRIASEPQLEALRASPEGVKLTARLDELHALWSAAIKTGAPMVAYDGHFDDQDILTARVLRAGVWVHTAKRFVPVGPPLEHASSAWLDLEHGRVITIGMIVEPCKSDMCPRVRRFTVDVHTAASPSVELAQWTTTSEIGHGIDVQSSSASVRIQTHDCTYTSCKSPWLVLSGSTARPDPGQKAPADAVTLYADYRGTDISRPHAGLSLAGPDLVTASGSIELDKRHRLTEFNCVDSDGSRALVAATFDRCDCENGAGHVLLHAITRVDLTSRTAEMIELGHGEATAVPDPDGAIYVQVGKGAVERYSSIGSVGRSSGEALPDGIRVLPPVGRRYCCSL